MRAWMLAGALAVAAPAWSAERAPVAETREPNLKALFEEHRAREHIPGTVFGIVRTGEPAAIESLGVRDTQSNAPVDANTRFRIASMSKAFTALAVLKLRDAGKLSLEAPAQTYVPELAGWKMPEGSRPITVRDLLHHTAGLVEDNPWGDRQQVLSEAEFTVLIESGMDFANAPGVRNEYSNYGYALLGRIIGNVSGRPYQDYIRDEIMLPLGMSATTFDIAKSPADARALGYRWEDGVWVREPDMRDGAFGAMGGVETTANDYAKWMAFLLSAWPAGDAPENGPVKRATVRDMVALASPMPAADRAKELGPPCRQSVAYGAGVRVVDDCELGRVITHGGGYPGYGSIMMLLPDAGVGLFAFSNRTYAPARAAGFKAMLALRRAGMIPDRPVAVSPGLAAAYQAAREVWGSGRVADAPLAGNVALDSDLARRDRELAKLKAKVGDCVNDTAIVPSSAMEGTFTWTCANGKVTGRVQRAPTRELLLQVIEFEDAAAS